MRTVYVDIDHTLLRPGRIPLARPSAARFLRGLREREIRTIALGDGSAESQQDALRDADLLGLVDEVCGSDDPLAAPPGPWVLLSADDPVRDGLRGKLARLGGEASPDTWVRHHVRCTSFVLRDREPLPVLLPLVVRTLELQDGPAESGRAPIPGQWFVLVVVRRDDRFLVVNELHHDGWYLPAGRVELAETLAHAARREVLEESGVHVEVTGLLRVEHRPTEHGCRVRVFVVAEALGDAVPRTTPNAHTREARWVTLDALRRLRLRTTEVVDVLAAVEAGCPIVPWSIWDPSGVFG
jgi:ADP-ribose pyrophosphatase YjhB (NUDIX family)